MTAEEAANKFKTWEDYLSYYSQGRHCSCHISPPCGYCTDMADEEKFNEAKLALEKKHEVDYSMITHMIAQG